MSAKPAHHRLRELLLAVLRTDADFAAFVMDHHPQVAQRFSDGQDRVQKTNLLLWHVAGQVILQELRQSFSQPVAAFESQHGPIAATDFLDRLRFAHAGSWQRTQAMTFALGAGLVAGLWLTLRVTSPIRQQPATTPDLWQTPPPAAVALDMTQAMQPARRPSTARSITVCPRLRRRSTSDLTADASTPASSSSRSLPSRTA